MESLAAVTTQPSFPQKQAFALCSDFKFILQSPSKLFVVAMMIDSLGIIQGRELISFCESSQNLEAFEFA